jgi:hypothetical protein
MPINLTDGLLRAVALFHPDLKPMIDMTIKYETQLELLDPAIDAADKESGSAFAAVESAAPDLAAAIKNLAASIPAIAATQAEADKIVAARTEVATRHILGARVMTTAEEEAWLNGGN